MYNSYFIRLLLHAVYMGGGGGGGVSDRNTYKDESVETGDESVETRDESIEAGVKTQQSGYNIWP